MADDVRYRKINPIYSAIDGGNYKGAIKLCQRKDIAKWDIARALNAYCLVMLHKMDEGLSLAREVKANSPTDESVLSALSLTFKQAKADEEAVDMYEVAFTAQPQNDSLAADLFGAYVRIGNFKKMQQLSQKLYKLKNNPKYIFWTVSSMLHQQDSLPVAMIDLVEKMVIKIFSERNNAVQPGAEELMILIDGMRRRAAHKDTPLPLKIQTIRRALDHIQKYTSRPLPAPISDDKEFLQDGSTVKAHPFHMKLLCIDLLKQLRAYEIESLTMADSAVMEGAVVNGQEESTEGVAHTVERLIVTLREVLVDMPDQWTAHEELIHIHCDMRFGRKRGYPVIDDTELSNLRRSILDMQQLPEKNRAPYLAEMLMLQLWTKGYGEQVIDGAALPAAWKELNTVVRNDSDMLDAFAALGLGESAFNSSHGEMARLLMSYIEKFENKQCCFNDLKPYLATLPLDMSRVVRDWALHRAEQLKADLREMAAACPPQGAEDRKDDEDVTVKVVTDKLCRLSKLLQITFFLNLCSNEQSVSSLSGVVDGASTAACELLDLYCSTHRVGAGKGVGGLREVQPGDELLMLCSTVLRIELLAYRKQCTQERLTETVEDQESRRCDRELELVRKSLQWASILQVGRKMSPESYCFTVDILEPLRMLNCSEYAIEQFNSLSVKYIQLDSMPYLIIPALIEGGMFTEAHRLCGNIVRFHASSQRETRAMIARSFEHANYGKGLELGDFAKRCQQSTQLALARAELPMLAVIDQIETWSDLSTYLQSYAVGMIPEAQRELSAAEMSALVDNMDYDLLTRVDDSPDGHFQSLCKATRRRQYEERVRLSQMFSRLVLSILQGDATTATSRLNAMWEFVFSSACVIPTLGPFMEELTVTKTGSDSEAHVDPIVWTQSFSSDGADEKQFAYKLYEVVLRLCGLAVHCITLNSQAASNSDTTSSAAYIQALCASLTDALVDLRVKLCLDESSADSKFLRFEVDMHSVLLRPSWLHQVTCFVRTVGSWGVMILSYLSEEVIKGSNGKKKSKKKAVVTASTERAYLESLMLSFSTLLNDLDEALQRENAPHSSADKDITTSIICKISALSNIGSGLSDATTTALQEAHVKMSTSLLSSQELVCGRLRDNINKKKRLLVINK